MRAAANVLDGAGAGMSGLCMVHCLALPLLSAGLPAVAVFAEAEWVHVGILVVAAPIALFAFLGGGAADGVNRSWTPVWLGASGLALMSLGAFGPPAHETWANVAGGLTLTSAHVWNWLRRRGASRTCAVG